MNDLYGIDPAAPSTLRDLCDLLRIFSVSQGRFIADFPSGWGRALHQHMISVSDLEGMAAVEAWLLLAKSSLLPQAEIYNEKLKWEENAVKLLDRVRLLIGPSGRPENIIKPLDKALLDSSCFPDSNGSLIPRTTSAYINAIYPLILTSPKIVLVDPYFSLSFRDGRTGLWRKDRRRDFLKNLLSECVKRKRVKCVDIFSRIDRGDNATTSLTQAELESVGSEAGCNDIELSLRPLKSDVSLDRHGRYCLSLTRGLHPRRPPKLPH